MHVTAKFLGEVTKFGDDSLKDSKIIQLFRDGVGGGGLESPPPVSIVLRRFYVLVYSTQRHML